MPQTAKTQRTVRQILRFHSIGMSPAQIGQRIKVSTALVHLRLRQVGIILDHSKTAEFQVDPVWEAEPESRGMAITERAARAARKQREANEREAGGHGFTAIGDLAAQVVASSAEAMKRG